MLSAFTKAHLPLARRSLAAAPGEYPPSCVIASTTAEPSEASTVERIRSGTCHQEIRRPILGVIIGAREATQSPTWHASNGPGEGNTLTLGRRSSLRHLRIYDKRGPTRIELETKGKYAGGVARKLIELRGDEEGMVAFVIGCLREFCDFGIQDGVHGARDVELLPWWRAFVGSVDRIGRLVVDRRYKLEVDRTLAWVERSVAPSLAMIQACYQEVGERLLRLWIEAGYDRLTNRHLAAIREFQYAYGRDRFDALVREGAA